jgi:hypothetical protein
MGTTTRQKIARAIKEAWFGRDRVRDEEGLSLWTVLGGLLLSALITAFFVIPNLLGARSATENAAPQHNLQAAIPAAKVLYGTNNGTYTGVTNSALSAAEPTLTFVATGTGSTGPHHVAYAISTGGNAITMAAASATGNCYYVMDVELATASVVTADSLSGAGTFYNAVKNPGSGCHAATVSTSAAGWQKNGFPSI